MGRALDEKARGKTRARVWDLIPSGLPASTVAGAFLPADLVVLDVDSLCRRRH